MNIISSTALKEAFYMQFYLDYKNFLNINMGVERSGNGSLKAKKDIYSKTLEKYGVFSKEKTSLDMSNVSDYFKMDKRVSGSIEDFFAIVGEDNNALNYVASLMQYMKNATTAVEGGWLMVEDFVNSLLLKHFWKTRIDEGSMKVDETRICTKMENGNVKSKTPVTYDQLFGNNPLLVTEYNVIELLKELPGMEETNKVFLFTHLDKSRILRNNFTHQKLLPDNFADAVVIARYKLYSYIAAALCLRTKEPVMTTRLTVTDHSEKRSANIKVWEVVPGKIDEEQVVERNERGWECSLRRFHTYRFEVSGSEQAIKMHLDWFSLSPCGEYDGIKLTLLDNNFEQVAQNPGATMSEVVKSNERIADTLANIDAVLVDATKAQKKEINKLLENQVNIQRSITEAVAVQAEASEEQRKQLVNINENLGTLVDMMAVVTTTLKRAIGESRDTTGALHEFTKSVNGLVQKMTPLLKTVEEHLSGISEKQARKKNDKIWFTIKRLPLWLALTAAAVGLMLHIVNTYTIYWMSWKSIYLWTLIGGTVLLSCYLLLVYATTHRKELITHRVKMMDSSAIGLSTLLWGAAIAVTPHPADEDYMKEFSFENSDDVCQLFVKYVEGFIKAHPESEVARSKLAYYYLDISNEVEAALDVARPMEDVRKYPYGCGFAAEAFLRNGDSLRVKEIIEEYARSYPNMMHPELERLHALLLINGNLYDSPNPDTGLAKLYHLVEKVHYQKACYDLGHWSATDLAMWRPGSREIATLRYDLPTAVKYLRRVADTMPRAALELGCLYEDFGVADSARYYLQKAVSLSQGDMRAEALFRMGLLIEKQGQQGNAPMQEAINMNYPPAVEHKALRTSDHRTAIEYMKRSGQYKGTRTIPPIVFEYLKASEIRNFTGLADSALKVLKEQRPECHFNRTFVNAMEAIMGTDRMEKNHDSAMVLLRQSAAEGCLYAKMMCCYQDAIRELENGGRKIVVGELKAIEPVIPFAGVLLADLLIKTGHYGDALMMSQYPIAKNLPAAAFVLSSIPATYDIKSGLPAHLDTLQKELFYSYILQKLVRLSPHKNRWLMPCYNADVAKRSYFRLNPDSSQVSLFWQSILKDSSIQARNDSYFADNREGTRFWVDVIAASDFLPAKLNVAFYPSLGVKDKEICEKLVASALRDLKRNSKASDKLWNLWLWCLGNCSSDFQLTLRNEGDDTYKKRYDKWVNLMVNGEPPTEPPFLPDVETITLDKPILLIEQLDELSGFIEEYNEVINRRTSKASSRYL